MPSFKEQDIQRLVRVQSFFQTCADVTLMISARYWVSEIFDLCCQCPTSKIAEHMVKNGYLNPKDTKNGWERYTGILRAWLRIFYQEENR